MVNTHAASPALSALLAAIHDRRGVLPEPIVSLATIVAREVGGRRHFADLANEPSPSHEQARDPADDHPLEWGLR